MKSLAASRNFLFVGESPFYKQIKAITGEEYRYLNFLSFCDAGRACRRLWLCSMNLDLMIYGGKELPEPVKTSALRVRDTLREIMEGAAAGEF